MERKRILAIILCLTMVISVAGCSNTTNVQSKNQSQIVNVKNHKIKIKAKDWSEDGKSLVDVTYNGKYTGKMKKKKPFGKGKFVSKNDDNVKWTYIGEFKNGTFNGYGSTTWEKNKYVKEEGKYSDGAFTPTKVEHLQYENSYYENSKKSGYHSFYMSEKGLNFFKNHQNFFPIDMNNVPQDYESNIAGQFDYPQASKNISTFYDKLYRLSNLSVVQNSEYSEFGQTVTEMLCVDLNSDNPYYYTIFYFGSTPYVEVDTVHQIVFLPQCEGSFEDNQGGNTLCMFVVATEMN